MPGPPQVTVLMSVHNDRRYLGESVGSILAQTFGDFELLIIDDGSTDGSWDWLSALTDPRVRLLRNGANLGLTRSLNIGLSQARGRYIARMDADDIAAPHRLERQVRLLNEHPDIGIVGSSRILIDEQGQRLGEAPALPDDLSIRWKCLLGNPFAHPAVMLRSGVLCANDLRYDESFRTAQDYELWSRFLCRTHGANLPDFLLSYRIRQGISGTRKPEQLRNHDRIALMSIHRLVPAFSITPEDIWNLRGRYGGFSVREAGCDPADPFWLARLRSLLDAFCAQYRDAHDIGAFRRNQEQDFALLAQQGSH